MRRLAAVSSGLLAASTLLACASGEALGTHGQVFGFDAGDDGYSKLDAASNGTDANASLPDASSNRDTSATDSGSDTSPAYDGGDGASSDDADGTNDAGPPDATGPSDGASSVDAASGVDASDAAACTSTMAVLGGSAVTIFGATSVGGAPLSVQSLTGSVTNAPALVAFGGGYQGMFTEAGDAGGGNALFGVSFAATSWTGPLAIGGAASAVGGPSLAVVGTSIRAVYLNPAYLFFDAVYGTVWDQGQDPVRPPNDGGSQAFGPVPAAAGGTTSDFVIAYEGGNQLPYVQTWTPDAGWDDGVALGSAKVAVNTPLAMASLGSYASDLVAAYVDGEGSSSANNTHLFASFRNAASKTWSAPAMVNINAYANTAPTLAALSGGRALLAWPGENAGSGTYASVYTPGSSPPWSPPAQVTSINGAVTIAAGVCGDDAEAVVVNGGAVYTLRLVAGSWMAPTAVVGMSGATFATIATTP